MQELTLELDQLRSGEQSATDVKAKEQALELLHWRLARVARQTATDELGNAALGPSADRTNPKARPAALDLLVSSEE